MGRKTIRWGLALYLFSVFFLLNIAYGSILIIAPHPDDDIIAYAGIIYRAKTQGESVTVVFMTNGDINGTAEGYLRQSEAVTAQANYLGMNEDDLIFLGYPDGYLYDIMQFYPNQTEEFTTPTGQSTTYGNRGLGRADYHSVTFGSHASYNGYNVLVDLRDIISVYRPDHILTKSEFDIHDDHSTTYNFLESALKSLNIPNYKPVVHQTIVHCGNQSWPNQLDASAYFSEIPNLSILSSNQLSWAHRQSIDVPLIMQSNNYAANPKYGAVSAHSSQGGAGGLLGRFIHKDEIFWSKNLLGLNQPPIVNAGVDQTDIEGALVTLSGLGSSDPDGDLLSYQWQQVGGHSVQLVNATSASPNFTAPSGLLQDEILSFQLVVSDGELGSLPDAVSITVRANASQPYSNIASLATVSASSESPQYEQMAVKAIDGVADGYPGDYTREWATAEERTGAWIQLTWSSAYVVDRVVLYDRPNLYDYIQAATLRFGDGSTIQVGPLNNAGAGVEYQFPPRSIDQMTLTVTAVSSSTQSVGLAEIHVYGRLDMVDLDEDCDVDGTDLVLLIESGNLRIESIAQNFGRSNCP